VWTCLCYPVETISQKHATFWGLLDTCGDRWLFSMRRSSVLEVGVRYMSVAVRVRAWKWMRYEWKSMKRPSRDSAKQNPYLGSLGFCWVVDIMDLIFGGTCPCTFLNICFGCLLALLSKNNVTLQYTDTRPALGPSRKLPPPSSWLAHRLFLCNWLSPLSLLRNSL